MKPERIQSSARVTAGTRRLAVRVYAVLEWLETFVGALKGVVRFGGKANS